MVFREVYVVHAAASEERFNRLVALLQRDGVDCAEARAVAEAFDPQQIRSSVAGDS